MRDLIRGGATIVAGLSGVLTLLSAGQLAVQQSDSYGTEQVVVGSNCRDGTRSSSLGQGTCSWHGGVSSIATAQRDVGKAPNHTEVGEVAEIFSVFAVSSVVILATQERSGEPSVSHETSNGSV